MEIRGWLMLFFFALLLVFSVGSGEAAVYALFFNISHMQFEIIEKVVVKFVLVLTFRE